jgi:hypothetical protein
MSLGSCGLQAGLRAGHHISEKNFVQPGIRRRALIPEEWLLIPDY